MQNKEKMPTWWSAKKTEAEWQKTIDYFFLNFTPKWFTFLGWLLILGVLKYIDLETDSRWISLIYGISFMTFFFFLQSAFYNFPFYKLLPEKFIISKRFAFVFSIVTAGALLIFIQVYLLEHIIARLAIR